VGRLVSLRTTGLRTGWLPQAKIVQLVDEGKDWKSVAAQVDGRSGKQIRDRYLNTLDPSLKPTSAPWSEHENAILVHGHAKWGSSWMQIISLLPGRSPNQAKNRWNSRVFRDAPPASTFSSAVGARAAGLVAEEDRRGGRPALY